MSDSESKHAFEAKPINLNQDEFAARLVSAARSDSKSLEKLISSEEAPYVLWAIKGTIIEKISTRLPLEWVEIIKFIIAQLKLQQQEYRKIFQNGSIGIAVRVVTSDEWGNGRSVLCLAQCHKLINALERELLIAQLGSGIKEGPTAPAKNLSSQVVLNEREAKKAYSQASTSREVSENKDIADSASLVDSLPTAVIASSFFTVARPFMPGAITMKWEDLEKQMKAESMKPVVQAEAGVSEPVVQVEAEAVQPVVQYSAQPTGK